MKKLFIFTLILILGCNTAPEDSTSNHTSLSGVINEFDKQISKDLSDDGIGGSMSAAIVKEGEIIWSKAYGYSDPANQVLADTTTIFRTGSISKTITAVLMMQLVEEGILSLDDPIEKYLPEIKDLKGYSDSTKITFKELASHTSGLIREPRLQDAASGPIDQWENKILQSIPETSFQSKPGERYSYSNIGYGILGLTLQRATNQPFMEMVAEKVFQPLGMINSYFVVPENEVSRLAIGISGGPMRILDRETPAEEHSGRGYKVPNGGVYSTPNDLARFVMGNMGFIEVLNENTRQLMQSEQTPGGDGFSSYGLGFSLYQDSTVSIAGHGGSVAGYNCYMGFDKGSQYGVIIMRNYNFGISNLYLRSVVLLKKLAALSGN